MKKLTNLIITSLIIFGAQASSAAVLTFEDVPGGSIQNQLGKMSTYKGYKFSSGSEVSDPNPGSLYWVDVVGSSWNYGAHNDSEFALSNQESRTGFIIEASTVDFTFGGLWAKKWATDAESGGADSLFGFLSGYKDNNLVWEVSTGLNGSYKHFGAQAKLIDELRLGFGNNFLVDDIVLNAVPVPAAAWLFGSGLIGLIAVARRKTQA